jgi:ankyrin repeat protein
MKSLLSYFFQAAAWAGVIDKNNALQLAARGGHTLTVTALLKAGANLHALDDEPLRTAAWWGRTDAVRALLEGGANVHAKHDEALRWAEEQKHLDTVKLLREWAAHCSQSVSLAPKP